MSSTSPVVSVPKSSTSKRRFRFRAILLGVLLPGLAVTWTLRRAALDRELIDAIKTEDTKVALNCLDAGADPNTLDSFDDDNSFTQGFEKILELLKRMTGAHRSQFYNPPLILLFGDRNHAVQSSRENLEIARALLKHGANINARDEVGATPLILAMQLKWNKTAQLLLDRGADIHLCARDGTTPLMVARGELTEALLRRGADVHAVDGEGCTALYAVCKAADLPAIRSLIAHGADVNAVAQDNSTPLLMAALSRSPDSLEAMRLLFAHGADIRVKTAFGMTVLMHAAQSMNAEKVKFVLEQGADINSKNREGRTALMMVARDNSPEIMKLLLEHGAAVNTRNLRGQTALSEAKRYHNEAEVHLLKAAGAKEPPPSVNPTPTAPAPSGFGGPSSSTSP